MSAEQPLPPEALIQFDNAGRAHEPDGSFMKNSMKEQIIDRAEQITEGLGGFETVEAKLTSDGIVKAKAEEAAQLQQKQLAVFDKVNAALEAGELDEFSAGPAYQKATGLDYVGVLGLGFSTYGDIVTGAKDHAEKIKAEEAKAAEKQKIAEDAKAHAAQWKAEADAARESKAAAQSRVDAISYNEKVNRGGEIGLSRTPGLAEQITEIAKAKAADENFNVASLETPAYSVTRNEAAEARQREYAQLLKEHDRAMLVGGTTEKSERMTSGEKRVVTAFLDSIFGREAVVDPKTNEVTEKTVRGRLKGMMDKFSSASGQVYKQSVDAIALTRAYVFSSEKPAAEAEKSAESKPKRIAGATMAVLGAAGMSLMMKYNNVVKPEAAAEAEKPVPRKVEFGGDKSLWLEGADYAQKLGYNLEEKKIQDFMFLDAINDYVLDVNEIKDPTSIPKGTVIKLPSREVLESLYEYYQKKAA